TRFSRDWSSDVCSSDLATFLAVFAQHVVADPDVGEGSAHHDLMVAAAGAVLVEVGNADPAIHEVLAGRRGRLDGARRRNMVGGEIGRASCRGGGWSGQG